MSDWEELPLGDHVLGESPRWDPRRQELVWVDVFQGVIALAHLEDEAWRLTNRHHLPAPVTSVGPAAPPRPGWWAATGEGVVHLSRDGAVTHSHSAVSRDYPALRTNDMVIDAHERLIIGLLAEDRATPRAAVVNVSPDGSRKDLVPGLITANGIALNADETMLYVIDSVPRTLSAFRYDSETGEVGRGRVLVRWEGVGTLDGMAIGPDGDLWVALWDGASLHRYSPEGELCEVVPTPVQRPTAVALAGPKRDLMVITSARQDISRRNGSLTPSPDGRLYARRLK